MYIPTPIDTSDVVLPEELEQLIEELARNVHDIWALGRIRDSWQYGPVKDSVAKTTPLLVPYELLPEEEKDYDRNTVRGTIEAILKLNYEIRKK